MLKYALACHSYVALWSHCPMVAVLAHCCPHLKNASIKICGPAKLLDEEPHIVGEEEEEVHVDALTGAIAPQGRATAHVGRWTGKAMDSGGFSVCTHKVACAGPPSPGGINFASSRPSWGSLSAQV